jgi:putative peptidoglycan lipid II flippase
VSLFGIGLNILLNSTLVWGLGFGHVGLAMTTAMIALLNFGQLAFYLRRRVDYGSAGEWARFIALVILASLGCGAGAMGVEWVLGAWQAGVWWRGVVALGLSVSAGVSLFAAVAFGFGLEEARKVLGVVQRKLFRQD